MMVLFGTMIRLSHLVSTMSRISEGEVSMMMWDMRRVVGGRSATTLCGGCGGSGLLLDDGNDRKEEEEEGMRR